MKLQVAGIVSTMAIMAVLSGAQAQTTNSNSNANSSSGAISGSNSSSRAVGGSATGNRSQQNQTNAQGQSSTTNTGVTLNQTSNTSPNTSANNTDRLTGGTSNTNQVSNSGYTSSDNIVRAAPTVYAPPVSGGSPCSLGYSAGASFLGWGAAAGGQVVDGECERRMHVAMLFNAGWKGPAKELACNNKEVYFAFRSSGEPCIVRPAWEPAGAPAPMPPMVQQQPVPIGPQQPMVTSGVVKDRSNLPRCKGPNDQGPCYGG